MNLGPLKEELGKIVRSNNELNLYQIQRIREGEEIARFFLPLQRKAIAWGLNISRELPPDADIEFQRMQPMGGVLRGELTEQLGPGPVQTLYLRPDLTDNLGAKVLSHELAHVFLTPNTMTRAEAETLAEATSFLVAQELGMDTRAYSANYIARFNEDWVPWRISPGVGALRIIEPREEEIFRVAKDIIDGVK